MPTSFEIEPVNELRAELAEGPVWHEPSRSLFWVDIIRGSLHQHFVRTGTTRTFNVGESVSAVAPAVSGYLMLAVRGGFARLNTETGEVHTVASLHEKTSGLRMNDGKCDALGRFWAGSMAFEETPNAGALYRLDTAGDVRMVLSQVTISNGLDWTSDDRLMYYVDSGKQEVQLFDFDLMTGALSNRRTFVEIPIELGTPDGLTLDTDGCVWVSLWAGGALHRYAPAGTLDLVVQLPVSHPTSCAFGGPDLRDLYITTAAVPLSAAARTKQPLAGSVLRCRPGQKGRPQHLFGG